MRQREGGIRCRCGESRSQPEDGPLRETSVSEDGGEGGIRTHVPVTRQDAFEAPPLRPLRYLSRETRGGGEDPPPRHGRARGANIPLYPLRIGGDQGPGGGKSLNRLREEVFRCRSVSRRN